MSQRGHAAIQFNFGVSTKPASGSAVGFAIIGWFPIKLSALRLGRDR